MQELMHSAGFEQVATAVRHFHPSDTPVTAVLANRLKALQNAAVLDRIGRIGGWYIVAAGRTPTATTR